MKYLPLLLAFATATASAPATATCQNAPDIPDILYIHGNILTGAHLKPFDPSPTPARVTALAVAGGKIVAAGSDAQILALKSANTRVVDLDNAFAMPGFNDAHTHLASAGRQKLSVDLDNTPSLAAMLATIQTYAARQPQGAWILGGGWDHTKWASKKLPTRQDLDAVTGSHPSYLERTDGHIAIANSAALAAAGITAATAAPKGGQVDLDPVTHEPTGIIRDAALALITPHIPAPDAAARRAALTLAIHDAIAHGVTSVQDLSGWDDFLVLEQMEQDHQLPLRISEWLAFNDPLDTLKAHRDHHDANDPLLHTGMLKGFMDGSLGSRTAALAAPYSDGPHNSGLARYDQPTLNNMTAERAAAGFQIGFHAIGDEANTMALNAFTAANEAVYANHQKLATTACFTPHFEVRSVRDPCGTLPEPLAPASMRYRFRIEHAQVLLPADFDRFTKLHIIASMQPSHLLTDMNWAAARLGPQRTKYSYAWRSFLDHGVTLAFGTDYPVESINPFRGLYAATTRMNETGAATYQPQEKITLNEAIYAYTQASAFAEFRERAQGRLEPGFLADIVVLDRDITSPSTTPQQLLHTRVLRTILGGETVYLDPKQ